MDNDKDKSRSAAAELRRRAEKQLKANVPEANFPRTDDEMQRLFHELQVHQVELEMQNAELRQENEAMETALGKYFDLYDFAPAGYFTLDRGGAVQTVNLSGAGLLGIERARLLGRRFGAFVAEKDRPAFNAFLDAIFSNHGKEACEVALRNKMDRQVFARIEAVGCAAGTECRVAVIDISERKRFEQVLKASERQLSDIYANVTGILFYLAVEPDGNFRFTSVNRAFLEITGLAENQVVGRLIQEVIPQSAHDLVIGKYREALRTNKTVRWEESSVYPTGRRYGDVAVTPIIAADGTCTHLIGIVHDITDRKWAEEEMRKSEHQLAVAQRIAHLGSWQWDSIADEITGSDEFYRIFSTVFSSYKGFLELVHPDDQGKVDKAVQDTLARQSPCNIHYRIVHSDGTIRIIHAQWQAIIDIAGKVSRMIGTAQDVTERRRIEDALAEKRRELEELNNSQETLIAHAVDELRRKDQMLIQQERLAGMGEMLNSIAHQWRQPLNGLGLIIQQMALFHESGEATGEYVEKSTEMAMNLIHHMSKTIEDFRNYFRVDKVMVPFGVNQVIGNTVSLIEKSFQYQQISITFKAEGDPIITGYPNEYAQVLLNVLMNARDVLVERKIIDARILLHSFAEGDRSVVTVTDNGDGIAAEIMGKLFDPYFSTKGPDKGTGIGLYMSKTIIEKNMGGRLTVQNTGNGAEFRIEV